MNAANSSGVEGAGSTPCSTRRCCTSGAFSAWCRSALSFVRIGFGTANFRPDIGLIDARVSWYVAIGAIVAGHVIAIWLAHRVALREFGAPRKAVIASVPLTVLMVIYTAISLSIIAEPMVKFDAQLPQALEAGFTIGPRT